MKTDSINGLKETAVRTRMSSIRGSTIIWLVFVMVAASILGTAVVKLNAGSSFSWVSKNINNTALYLAESGGRYALPIIQAELPAGPWTNTDALVAGGAFNVKNGSFTLTVDHSYAVNPNYVILTSTGTINSGTQFASTRKMVFLIPKTSGPSTIPGTQDPFNNLNNWLPVGGSGSVGTYDIDDTPPDGAASALELEGGGPTDVYVVPASAILRNILKSRWSMSNGLSYDAQVKIDTIATGSYASGLYFRMHPTAPNGSSFISFGVAFLNLKDYNDTRFNYINCNNQNLAGGGKCQSPYAKFTADTTYIVLFSNTNGNETGYQTIAYYPLPTSGASDMAPVAPWATILVRIMEVVPPSGSGCPTSGSPALANVIQVYYSTTNNLGGNNIPTDITRRGNPLGSVYWPSIAGGTADANDHYTLAKWDAAGAGTGPGFTGSYLLTSWDSVHDGSGTAICTTANSSRIAQYDILQSTPFPPEIALMSLGNTVQQHTWFTDFALGTAGLGGGGNPIVYYP